MNLNFAGIYEIRRDGTNELYVGSSSVIRKRFTNHKRELNRGKHHAHRLQNSWSKYGEAAFVFAVLEVCECEKSEMAGVLMRREQHWIDTLKPCFNTVPAAGSTLGFKMPREIVERHRAQMTGRKQTPEQAAITKNLAKGLKRSDETKEKLRQAGLRRGMPKNAVENSAAARRGKPLSAEHIAKVVLASTGRRHRPEVLKARSAALTAETREKMGAGSRGRTQSPEHLAKRLAAVQAYHERRRNAASL